MNDTIPVILFAYARPDHLRRTLRALEANQVPRILAFSDSAAEPAKAPASSIGLKESWLAKRPVKIAVQPARTPDGPPQARGLSSTTESPYGCDAPTHQKAIVPALLPKCIPPEEPAATAPPVAPASRQWSPT